MCLKCFFGALAVIWLASTGRADDKPIPQDQKRMEEMRKAAREFYRKQYVDGYEQAGVHNAKWDDLARKAVAARVEYSLSGVRSEATKHVAREFERHAIRAVEKDCTDPLAVFIATNAVEKFKAEDADAAAAIRDTKARRYAQIIQPMLDSKYPALAKIEVIAMASRGVLQANPQNAQIRKLTEDRVNACIRLLPEVVADGSIAAFDAAVSSIGQIEYAGLALNRNRKVWHDRIMAALTKAHSPEVFCLTTEGNFLVNYAWDARGSGSGATVTPRSGDTFHERLREAETVLKRAYRANPNWAAPAAYLVDLSRGLAVDREEMETWFERAMTADGDCLQACIAKKEYMMPKWHGDEASALAFGRQCRDTKNWHAGLPFLLVQIRNELGPRTAAELRTHLSIPAVWEDYASVYEPLLKEHPKALVARTEFFRWAVIAGKFELAYEIKGPVNGSLWCNSFSSPGAMDRMIEGVDRKKEEADKKKKDPAR